MKYQNPDIESSYKENNIGQTLYNLVLEKRPKKIVEIGALYGYSALAMAEALQELGEGHINAYDLFEDYPFKHPTLEQTTKNIARYGLTEYVTLTKKSLEEWLRSPEPFDLLHVDISNTADTINFLYEATKERIKNGSIVIFEGGSKERDEVEWVKKYNKRPIGETTAPFHVIDARFPSLSMLGS
jgi:predicted O-methyltransferase YrrM